MVAGLPLCSLYCNTLLANLNARAYILGGEPDVIDMDSAANVGSQAPENTNAAEQPGVTQLVFSARQVGLHVLS